jgi:hypothetical protein
MNLAHNNMGFKMPTSRILPKDTAVNSKKALPYATMNSSDNNTPPLMNFDNK